MTSRPTGWAVSAGWARSAQERHRLVPVLGAVGAVVVVLGVLGWSQYLLLAALVMLAAIGLLNRPQRGILLLAALAPFDGLLLIIPHPQIVKSWKEIVVLATLLATVVSPRPSRAYDRRNAPGWLPAAAGWVLVGLASAATVSPVQALTGFRIDFFYLLLALAVWRTPLDATGRDRLVTILMVNGVITSLVGIAQQGIGASGLHSIGYTYNDVIRFAGSHLRSFSTFNQPFPFGFFVMMVLLVGLPVALQEPARLRNRLFLLSLPILGVGMLTSLVRAAWVGAGIGWIYLGVRRHRALLLAVPLALVALLYLPGSFSNAALSGSSLGQRGSTWGQNLSHVLSHPFGSGIGSAGAAAQKTASLTGTANGVFEPDNYYFKTVYELGVPGVYFLILLFVAAFWETRRRALLATGRDAVLALGVSASVLAAAVASTIATYFEIFPMDLFFWLLITVVATLPAASDAPLVARAAPGRAT